MTKILRTQPEPEHIARAADALDAILAGDLEIEVGFCVSAALAVLCDVFPPYPPQPQPEPIDLDTGLQIAVQELAAAIEAASSAEEAIRAGRAARELRPLLGLP